MAYPIGERPPPNLRQPVRVELFFLTHSETGEPLANSAAVGTALAGAVLVDLLLQPVERIRVVGEALVVVNPDVTGDPVADWAVRTLGGSPTRSVLEPRSRVMNTRDGIRALGVRAYERTAAGLYAGDLVSESRRRRMAGNRRRYQPTDPATIARIRGRLCSVLTGHTRPDPQTDALGGLVLALDLASDLYLDSVGLDVRGLLTHMVDRVGQDNPAIRQLIAATDSLIAEAAVAVYR